MRILRFIPKVRLISMTEAAYQALVRGTDIYQDAMIRRIGGDSVDAFSGGLRIKPPLVVEYMFADFVIMPFEKVKVSNGKGVKEMWRLKTEKCR